ncbi:MAG: Biotin carboxylase of acetyl-CoA carboxylase [uncultured Thermomicrobiales bacterium]|uniref:Biotin carboxylase n=1 Tax=uncultured Thermomicrobiales bacterium TaxID=1645740 RepID=A0A6J4VH38_9BACT|nr:MAG: Biotin carboxylase of acetyl-CoA carboxylase [uncultured Thermomicrobiales bacterium]
MPEPLFRKIMIANRGEIALRILRACRDLGIPAVVGYSAVDRDSLAVRLADEAVCIGPDAVAKSYNNIPAVISAALITGCDALHPGYGFLAENAFLAEICQQVGITFIGPRPEVIEKMGNKAIARDMMRAAGVPMLPGTDGPVENLGAARQAARKIGYPVIIKAVAGGGGRGMRVANDDAELTRLLPLAQSEADNAFGDNSCYIERYLSHPRHVEVQVLGDSHGNVIAVGERDCSLQRRHQKVVEEAPAPNLSRRVRENLLRTAVRGAKSASYTSAGTLEFLLDSDGRFYFMEMNTRIQVEHPITEETSGLDLVAWQIRIAAGHKIDIDTRQLEPSGHSIECRITAEDASKDFRPNTGTIDLFVAPGGPGVRVDSHLFSGYTVPPNYDSLLAKIIVHGSTRDEAIARMERALRETVITGISHSTPFHQAVMADQRFRDGEVHTGFVPELLARSPIGNDDFVSETPIPATTA